MRTDKYIGIHNTLFFVHALCVQVWAKFRAPHFLKFTPSRLDFFRRTVLVYIQVPCGYVAT